MLDLFGKGLTLLRFDEEADIGPLARAAEEHRLPFSVADIDDPSVAELYGRGLVLVRPDGHVAWRGDGYPRNAGALLDTVRGA